MALGELARAAARRSGWRRAGRAGRRGAGSGARICAASSLELGVVGAGRRDHHALLVERRESGRHAARGRPADVGVVGAAGGEAEQLAVDEDGEIRVMSGRWVPPR